MSRDETDHHLPKLTRQIVDAGLDIADLGPDRPEFLHAVLCQLGLPRSRQTERVFERSSGNASIRLAAGAYHDGFGWQEAPLPYGSKPRLALYHICSEAIRTQSREISTRDGIVPFLERCGIGVGGRSFANFKYQMTWLSVCDFNLAFMTADKRIRQTRTNPIKHFDFWANPNSRQRSLWPDSLLLDYDFFETLREHAVPLDPRAIHALQHSALALDVYTWLAHRLCRIRKSGGVKLSWRNLREQFGQEYKTSKDFKREFTPALRKACAVYPDARIEDTTGGIMLYSSPPPIPKSQVVKLSR
jgi:hypothetical protein